MNSTGKAIGYLWMLSPIILGLFKLLKVNPFSNMEWWHVTFPWWSVMGVSIFAHLVAHIILKELDARQLQIFKSDKKAKSDDTKLH